MSAPKCPFQNPIISEDFGCRLARHVTVRNAPEVHCSDLASQERCERLHDRLKAVGLDAFGMEDDLLTTPHSVMQKIQYGGLLGLQDQAGGEPPGAGRIEDINALVEDLDRRFGIEELAFGELAGRMTEMRLRRRRGRGR